VCLVLGAVPAISSAELRDPTRPLDFSEADLEAGLTPGSRPANAGYVLQSILVSPTRRIAIVNGERVQTGDEIGDAKVVAIQPWSVHLKGSQGKIELRITTIEVKTPARDRPESEAKRK
jgi:MSHA biogenesis protein MshK